MKPVALVAASGISAGGITPLVLAQATPGVTLPVWLISLLATAALGVIGFLLKRALEQFDKTLAKLDERGQNLDKRFDAFDARFDRLDTRVGYIEQRMADRSRSGES